MERDIVEAEIVGEENDDVGAVVGMGECGDQKKKGDWDGAVGHEVIVVRELVAWVLIVRRVVVDFITEAPEDTEVTEEEGRRGLLIGRLFDGVGASSRAWLCVGVEVGFAASIMMWR